MWSVFILYVLDSSIACFSYYAGKHRLRPDLYPSSDKYGTTSCLKVEEEADLLMPQTSKECQRWLMYVTTGYDRYSIYSWNTNN
jgi:hypothetical protein